MTQSLIQDLLLIVTAGLIAGIICRWLRISVLIGYLVMGTVLGQGFLDWVQDENHQLENFAEVGVFLLLFTIGLEFSLDDLRRTGGRLVLGGVTQMTLVMVPVTLVLMAFGNSWQSAWLVGAAVSFSSTVLVFKALSEWGQADSPHGKRAVGILLFQDAALIPLLLLVPLLTGGERVAGIWDYVLLVMVSILFVVAVIVLRTILAGWLIPKFAGARSPELIILFTIASLGGVTLAAYSVGLPAAIGAFAAGLIFNGNRWTKQIDALLLPFRETFAAVFFVGLGLLFDPRLLYREPGWALGTLVAVITLKTFSAGVSLRLTGLPFRSAFGMGVGLSQIGEFAFVLASLGLEAGLLTQDGYQRVLAVAVGSLILTPALLRRGLGMIPEQHPATSASPPPMDIAGWPRQATVIGAGPIGKQVASQLEILGMSVCLIDLSPINLQPFAQLGFATVAGDASQPGILQLAQVAGSDWIAVCVPHDDSALQIVRSVRRTAPQSQLIVRCRYLGNAEKLKLAGANHVVSEEAEASLAILGILSASARASGEGADGTAE
jgi:CPA2 family monovalent cation:H+ antiporter-2